MSQACTAEDFDVAIVGGGAAGALAAIQLLRRATAALRIVLVDPGSGIGQGIAYATRRPEHLLNVPAGRMSGFPDAPDDFADFLLGTEACAGLPRETLAHRYVPRRLFADYLHERLRQARADSPGRFEVIHDRVLALDTAAGGIELSLRGGGRLRAGRAILAVGNALRPLPARGAGLLDGRHLVEAWDSEALAAIPAEASVCIVGSGLSMADAAVTLHARGHRGPIHVVSRHALLPLPHAEGAPATFDPQPLLAMTLRQRLRALRAHAAQARRAGIPWQNVMERIRPLGQMLWRSLSHEDQRRFLRHAVRYWDVHRHRIAAPVHDCLQALLRNGQLHLHRARLETVATAGACVQLGLNRACGPLYIDAHCVINATGVEMRAQAMRNPLLQQLVGSGVAVAGPHGIGVDTAEDGSLVDADGHADPRVRVIGSLRIGRLWESLAIPELRGQAQQAAMACAGTDAGERCAGTEAGAMPGGLARLP